MPNESPPPAPRRSTLPAGLVAVVACICTYGVTAGLTYPLIALILESRGVDGSLIGLNAATPAIATLLFSPFIPRIIARLGLRSFLYACLALDLALVLALPAYDSLEAWYVLRAGLGVTGAGLFIASETWIATIAEPRHRGRVMAVYNAVLSGSFALSPLIIPLTGIHGWAPFLVGAAFIVLAAVPMALTRAPAPPITGAASASAYTFAARAPSASLGVLLVAFVYAAASSLLPIYGLRNGLAGDIVPVLLTATTIGGVALQFPIGWLADRLDRRVALGVCTALSALGAALLPLVIDGGPALWLLLFVWGGAFSGVYTVAMAIVGDRFAGADLATAMASFGIMWGMGGLIGPAIAGAAIETWNPHGFPAVLALAWLPLLALALRRAP
ncbi:MAG: MFS transporter [Chromatiales bacterium]|nr:MFS transporter [Chromatiales bacterium]